MMYSLERVTKFFRQGTERVHALSDLTLQVQPGELVAVLGQSGAGKTTLFRLLNGTIRPSSGSLLFDGADIGLFSNRELRAMRRRVGMVYQQHNLVPSLTALENTLCGALGRMSFLATLRSVFQPAKTDVERATYALESVGLVDKRFARADELSGGQQQRLAAARVLMQAPDVILADEPTASLDPELAESLTSLLASIARDGKKTLIMALHRVDLAQRHFPRVIGMREGSVTFDLPATDIRSSMLAGLYAQQNHAPRYRDGDSVHYRLGCAR